MTTVEFLKKKLKVTLLPLIGREIADKLKQPSSLSLSLLCHERDKYRGCEATGSGKSAA